MNDDHFDYDDSDHVAPTSAPTAQEILTQKAKKALPYLPYAVLAVGAHLRSANWLIAAVFALVAVKPFQRFVTISNCNFTAQPLSEGPGLMIR